MKNNLKYNLFLVAALLVAAGASFFFSQDDSDISKNEVKKTESLVIQDDLGREVKVNLPIKRIVSGYSAITEMLLYLDAKDKIVAATRVDAKELGVKSVGSHMRPDVEALVGQNPDLVILSSARPLVVEKISEVLSKENIPVLAFHSSTVAGALNDMEKMATLLGRTDGKELKERQLKRLDKILAKTKLIPESKRPRVFFEVRNAPNLLTNGTESLVYDVVKLAGGDVISKQKGKVKPYEIEKLMDQNPDFYLQQYGAMNKNPLPPNRQRVIRNLDCVKKGRFATLDEKLISRPGPRVVEAVETVYSLLFPKEN